MVPSEVSCLLSVGGHVGIPFQSLLGNIGSSQIEVEHSVVLSVVTGTSGFLSVSTWESGLDCVLRHGTVPSSWAAKVVSCLLSSSGGDLSFSELQRGVRILFVF